ncbi:serine/threonine-protein kinase [Psychrobacter aquaticus]|uniref:Serine/threonine protein kinase n=1 Tax=Psychrobacter aquaticus CMS 56 TaxID=1354303 RepID=U4T8N0_9GAMM|nr:serine/threonine-protein kinase [Psychrobacter aquaticus]ERL56491.1 serine/threonine protein kinase [Psychrobacter aquaticus CMS 56]
MLDISDIVHFNNDDYTVSSFLGQGGIGHVFLIKEKNGTKKYALKTLQYCLEDTDTYRSLINEWELAQSIRHKNVISYRGFDNGSVSKTPYIIMDLAEDGSLQDFLNVQKKMLDEQLCLNIFHQIIDGMEAINQVLVHRDIKPDNIFIDNGVFKIADFGLAKIVQDKTRSKTFKGWGTEPYIAPEAYKFEKNTIQMDMYSIGLVFFQIAGREHALGNPKDWETAHLMTVPKALNKVNNKISPKVADVINKLIEKRPKDRYQNWSEVRKELNVATDNNKASYRNSVNRLLDKKLSKDLEIKGIESQNTLKDNELLRREGIVGYQFEKVIRTPLKDLMTQLNKTVARSESAELIYNLADKIHDITFSFDGKKVGIWLSVIDQSDELSPSLLKQFRVVSSSNLNISKSLTPKLRGKKILAWGAVNFSDSRGFNLLLVQSEDDEYGDWYILRNTNLVSTLNSNQAEPFALDRKGLRLSIYLIDESCIYKMDVEAIERTDLIDLIADGF